MIPQVGVAIAWGHGVLLAGLPWLALWRPAWVPLAAVLSAITLVAGRRDPAVERLPLTLGAVSSFAYVAWAGGWRVVSLWFLLVVVAVVFFLLSWERRTPRRLSIAGAVVAWATVFVASPALLDAGRGGWLAPAILLATGLRLVDGWRLGSSAGDSIFPVPPSREVRGTLSLEGMVLAGDDGLPRSVPVDLEARAGESIAVVCDDPHDVQALADTLSGRRRPLEGEVSVDGIPLTGEERLVAVVGPGERFVRGSLAANLEALLRSPLTGSQRAAVRDACSLEEVEEALQGRRLAADGGPLRTFHRLLVLAARVIPSRYRVVVVLDPMPWVNSVRGEIWRTAVVRSSVGRTSVWLTADRNLAARAVAVYELRHGNLRAVTFEDGGGHS